ncbi:MAG: Ig-like domain-containing protein, partial [Actinomycetes bacterium]
ASVNISKKVLEVTPAESMVSIDYGSTTIPALDAKIEGFVNSEDASSFVPGHATDFVNGDGTETTVSGTSWFLAPTCAPVNLFLPSGEMVNAGTSGVYYNCSGGSADNYVFEHSGNAAITIRQTKAQLEITSNVLTSTYGQTVDFTVHLVNNSGLPAQTTLIEFTYDDNIVLDRCTLGDLSRNACALSTNLLPQGTHTITASWFGPEDVNFGLPTPASTVVTVTKAPVVLAVSSNHNPATSADSITFTATLTGTHTAPTGSVTFVATGINLSADCVAVNDTQSECVTAATTLVPGTYVVDVNYSGDSNYNGNVTSYTQVVTSDAAVVTIETPSPTSVYTDSVGFTVTVHGDSLNPNIWPTGTVVITDNNRIYAANCLLEQIGDTNDSSCSFNVIGMEIGVHEIGASYGGDAIFPASSTSVSHHVQIATGVSLTSSLTPSYEGAAVTFTATVSSERGAPSNGTIVFKELDENGALLQTLGTCPVVAATCSITVEDAAILNAGPAHKIVAQFIPDSTSDFNGVISDQLLQQVNGLSATVTVTQNVATTLSGQVVNFTVNVVGNSYIPTGTVHLTITGASNETLDCTLANGHCTVGIKLSASGEYTIVATYAADSASAYTADPSAEITHTVDLNTTVVAVASSKNPSIEGDSVIFTATVTGENGVPSAGSIQFYDGSTPLDSCLVVAGTCSITVSDLTAAGSPHAITASFTPIENSIFNSATSNSLLQEVTALSATVTVTQDTTSTHPGQVVNFTVNVVGNSYIPTGTAHLVISSTSLTGPINLDCTLANGHCTVGIDLTSIGEYTVVATYTADTSSAYVTAPSESIFHTVAIRGTYVGLTSSKNPSIYLDNITLTATVVSEYGEPSAGTIEFWDHSTSPSTSLDTCQVAAGTCSIFINSLIVRTHPITAVFTPVENSIFAGAVSDPLDQIVSPTDAVVTVSSNLNPAVIGQTITF